MAPRLPGPDFDPRYMESAKGTLGLAYEELSKMPNAILAARAQSEQARANRENERRMRAADARAAEKHRRDLSQMRAKNASDVDSAREKIRVLKEQGRHAEAEAVARNFVWVDDAGNVHRGFKATSFNEAGDRPTAPTRPSAPSEGSAADMWAPIEGPLSPEQQAAVDAAQRKARMLRPQYTGTPGQEHGYEPQVADDVRVQAVGQAERQRQLMPNALEGNLAADRRRYAGEMKDYQDVQLPDYDAQMRAWSEAEKNPALTVEFPGGPLTFSPAQEKARRTGEAKKFSTLTHAYAPQMVPKVVNGQIVRDPQTGQPVMDAERHNRESEEFRRVLDQYGEGILTGTYQSAADAYGAFLKEQPKYIKPRDWNPEKMEAGIAEKKIGAEAARVAAGAAGTRANEGLDLRKESLFQQTVRSAMDRNDYRATASLLGEAQQIKDMLRDNPDDEYVRRAVFDSFARGQQLHKMYGGAQTSQEIRSFESAGGLGQQIQQKIMEYSTGGLTPERRRALADLQDLYMDHVRRLRDELGQRIASDIANTPIYAGGNWAQRAYDMVVGGSQPVRFAPSGGGKKKPPRRGGLPGAAEAAAAPKNKVTEAKKNSKKRSQDELDRERLRSLGIE